MSAVAPAEQFDVCLDGDAAQQSQVSRMEAAVPTGDEALLRRLTRERMLAKERSGGLAEAARAAWNRLLPPSGS